MGSLKIKPEILAQHKTDPPVTILVIWNDKEEVRYIKYSEFLNHDKTHRENLVLEQDRVQALQIQLVESREPVKVDPPKKSWFKRMCSKLTKKGDK